MDKEDKQIIERATKENWRIGDRTRLKHLLEKNLKLYRENVELEEKISVLLSCKNCPENKGGYICAKEYENKCLAQKIQFIKELQVENTVLERRIERAKECMKKLLFIINSDPANYNCKGLVQDAEDFIYNRTCNIRQQGEHCISKTRCIMCDKEDEKVK